METQNNDNSVVFYSIRAFRSVREINLISLNPCKKSVGSRRPIFTDSIFLPPLPRIETGLSRLISRVRKVGSLRSPRSESCQGNLSRDCESNWHHVCMCMCMWSPIISTKTPDSVDTNFRRVVPAGEENENCPRDPLIIMFSNRFRPCNHLSRYF